MAIQIYHNPRCSKSRQTLALLEEQGITPKVVLYLEHPPTKKTILELATKLRMKPRAMMRDKEALFKELGLKEVEQSDAAWAQVIADHPKLLERPIVVHGAKAAMGRPPENILSIL